jgi:hydroxypyruvate isomerase
MLKIAANISVLFREVPLLERFAAARAAGFDGVEMQSPYGESPGDLAYASRDSGLPTVLINGPVLPGLHPSGICGRPEMRTVFREQLPTVCAYAEALGVRQVHLLAGVVNSPGEAAECWRTYAENLMHAADVLGSRGIQILIEPLNPADAPDYLLNDFEDARDIIARCNGRIGLQFDVYHASRLMLEPAVELKRWLPLVRHVQFADAPGRHEPGSGQIAFEPILRVLQASGYDGWLSAEYAPSGPTAVTLDWMTAWRAPIPGHHSG